MADHILHISILALCLHFGSGKILRNNALMSKMVSDFRSPESPHEQLERTAEKEPPRVLNLMQNVLCKNFPSIPCDMIMGDSTLRELIERSIQQLKYKKKAMEKTTQLPGYQLSYPVVNSEELSNYLALRNRGSLLEKSRQQIPKLPTPKTTFWSADDNLNKPHKPMYASKRTAIGHKNIRKFYPHKIKYKDKNGQQRKDFVGDYSDDRLSMSVEIPDMTLTKKHQHYSYKREPNDPPVWRIDYMKHGEPSLNRFGYEADQLKGKLVKNSPGVIVDGRPAAQLFTDLFKSKDASWVQWHSTTTSSDGRIQFPFTKDSMSAGTYKLKFNVGDYYTRNEKETIYPYVEIVFTVKEDEHYHIPLLLSPYGYSTYRGS
ncbi:uncharacterized protein isoform X2 [Choristoneura fumiferana]|uniref:uncharacterized protein isoform X2 n=1 Tax=Choristoneura fumiferana TaxID=7141 RepID=UPI003D15725F